MSWLFSQALVAAYSEASCSAGAPSAPSNTTPTPQAFLLRDKTTDAWSRFPSGTTCEPLTADRGEELLTLFRAGFLARTYRSPAKEPGSPERKADSGPKWPESLAKWDRATSLWKTRQLSLFADSEEFSEIWPKWGLMLDGECWEQSMPGHLTEDLGSGLWPTPTVCGNNNRKGASKTSGDGLATAVKMRQPRNTESGGPLNPDWVDWLIGWPIGHSALNALETPKFQQWLQLHGAFSAAPYSTQPHT